MNRTTAGVLLGVAALAFSRGAQPAEVGVVPFDSGTRVVREVAEALTGTGRSILESYPRGSEVFLGLVSLFPENARIAAIDWGMRLSLGHRLDRAAEVSVDALAEWCTAQYPGTERYPVIVLGSPNGAVAHLCALLGAPFLTTSFGLCFRHPTIDPKDLDAYRKTSFAAATEILAANPSESFEIVCHYDPIHDRSMVRVADFVRIKLLGLPACYRTFVRDRLAPRGTLVLVNCTYAWPQIELSERVHLQVGGLGGIDPTEYIEQWEIEEPTALREESEWGCPAAFAAAVATFAAENDHELLQVERAHPAEFSHLAHAAYLACSGVRSELLLIDTFNHLNPRTNLETGIPGLWLPFNTTDGLAIVEDALTRTEVETAFFAPLPSFARSPDTLPLDALAAAIAPYGNLEWIGVRPDKFPADPLAPYRFVGDMGNLHETFGQPTGLRLSVVHLSALLDSGR